MFADNLKLNRSFSLSGKSGNESIIVYRKLASFFVCFFLFFFVFFKLLYSTKLVRKRLKTWRKTDKKVGWER